MRGRRWHVEKEEVEKEGQEDLTLAILVRVAPTHWSPEWGARRPDPAVVERLRRDFGAQGMLCYATSFGLVCTGRREVVGRILPGAMAAAPGASLPVPEGMADVIEQIMVAGLARPFAPQGA